MFHLEKKPSLVAVTNFHYKPCKIVFQRVATCRSIYVLQRLTSLWTRWQCPTWIPEQRRNSINGYVQLRTALLRGATLYLHSRRARADSLLVPRLNPRYLACVAAGGFIGARCQISWTAYFCVPMKPPATQATRYMKDSIACRVGSVTWNMVSW